MKLIRRLWTLVLCFPLCSLLALAADPLDLDLLKQMFWAEEYEVYTPPPPSYMDKYWKWVAATLPQEEPPSEDPHAGQPEHCTNAKEAPEAHKCACKKSEDMCDVEDKACRVYCRKDKCYCAHSCDS